MDMFDVDFFTDLAEIILIDMVMSADNAVAIALACRGLPPGRHSVAFFLGATGAVSFRFAFASFVTFLLDVPYLRLIAAAGLIHVAVKMLSAAETAEVMDVPESKTVWQAVRVILMADLVLSFDNAIAVAAAADSNPILLAAGMLVTAPLLIYGSRFVSILLDRFPILIPMGAAVLGWVSGKMAVSDVAISGWIATEAPAFIVTGPVLGAAFVLLVSGVRRPDEAPEVAEHAEVPAIAPPAVQES